MFSKIFKNNEKEQAIFAGVRVKTISVALSIITTIGGAVYAIDDRYATENELNQVQEQTIGVFKQYLVLQYQDDLMDLKYKEHQGEITSYEETKIDRIEQRLDQLQSK